MHSSYMPSAGKSFKRLQAQKSTISARFGSISVRGKRRLPLYNIYTESLDPRFEKESKKNKSYYSYTLLFMGANLY